MKELRATAALFVITVGSSVLFWLALPKSAPSHPATPPETEAGGYLSSDACRACHPSEYASWHDTFHRTMTRAADELGWDGDTSPALPARLEQYGRAFVLEKSEDRVTYRGPDLHVVGRALAQLATLDGESDTGRVRLVERAFSEAPEAERELVMVTGSHHYLAFWAEGGDDAELRQIPFVYLLDEARFLPRKDAFLQPPDALPVVARWNANCIQCHSVAGRPSQTEGHDPITGAFWERYDTEVAERGIACEACHGPGRKHAEHYRNPLSRVADRATGRAAHIFVPGEDAGASGSAVCGQCHSYFVPQDAEQWWTSGFTASYSVGDSLDASRHLLSPGGTEDGSDLIDRSLGTIFWEDGSVMVGGREYNGLIQSPCYLEAAPEAPLGCTSCHSMHSGPPDKQISPKKAGDAMCTDCHSKIAPSHTRHAPESSGSRCVNCHMPRTSYALLHGIPSHRIASPSPNLEGPPHACALCHVDRTAAWIGRELAHFRPTAQEDEDRLAFPTTPGTQKDLADVPWAAARALSGNAAERALFAYAFGTEEALEASDPAVARLVLPRLTRDPYAAVRLIAKRAEKRLPKATPGKFARAEPAISDQTLSELETMRDNTPIVISE